MTQEVTEIEVEVVEIDGIAPSAPQPRASEEAPPRRSDWQDWRQWQGRVTRLDSRWWPLWVFLGVIALALALTVGLVLGVIIVIFRILRGFVRAILN